MDPVTKQIISLFIIVLIGFYCGKKSILDEVTSKGVSKLVLGVSNPLLIITSFNFTYTSDIANNIIKAFIYGLIIFILTPLFIKPLLIKTEKRKRNILQFALVFSNCGFMGFPIVKSVFGNEGVIYASIFNMIFNIFVWTYGVMLFSDVKSTKEMKSVFKNPGIIAALIGVLIFIFSIEIPLVLLGSMEAVAELTTPLSMLIIGSQLSRTDFKKLNDISIYYGSFIKLILIPLLLYLVSNLFEEKSIVLKTYILLQAMPSGSITSMFSQKFNKEKEYSALIVSFSTLLSVITLPLVIKLFF